MKSREASRPPGYYSQATMVTASDDSSLDGDANYVPPEDDDDDDTSNDIGESETDDVEHVRRDDSGTNRIDFEDGVETSGHWRWKVQYNLSKAWRREGESTQSKASRSAVLSLSKPKKGFTGMPSTILLELNKVPYSATAMQPYPIEMVVSLAPRNTGQSKSSVLAHCERVCYLRIESWPGAAASTPPMNATKHVLIAFKTPELCEGFCRMVKPCIRLKALPPTGPWPKPNWVKKFVTLATGKSQKRSTTRSDT
ncbi:hypothetical protein L202_05287 [Cryptococcus amylolentus CBS 6039]|uniref:Uncharacterized protein n=1 Tax=Cryptococcus amylolentus CBS 6039 TaxID=1295533 RepID=A0A1E3HMI6_9TREE|nr:hypothetical protein L202_05287 [Cryptococcus amylolentus CBS 6039]ODN76641.1 hypothetical protein L202_05287 [Cryptococcus amylolentus CBS 6039]